MPGLPAGAVVWLAVAVPATAALWWWLRQRHPTQPDPPTDTAADPPRVRIVFLEWHELDRGLWCDRCLLPSRRRLALVDVSCLHRAATLIVCDDCGDLEQEPHR